MQEVCGVCGPVSNGVREAVAGVNLSGPAYSNSLYVRMQVLWY